MAALGGDRSELESRAWPGEGPVKDKPALTSRWCGAEGVLCCTSQRTGRAGAASPGLGTQQLSVLTALRHPCPEMGWQSPVAGTQWGPCSQMLGPHW